MSTLDSAVAAELVARILAGDETAEAELVERVGRTLRFLARRHSRREADAEDLYQETLMLAIDKIRRNEVRQPENLAGFLRALVKNLAVSRYRRHAVAAEQPSDHLAETAESEDRGALDGLLHRERADRTRELLAQLDRPRDRAILFRYYLADESSPTICEDLGIDRDHFYRVLHRARTAALQVISLGAVRAGGAPIEIDLDPDAEAVLLSLDVPAGAADRYRVRLSEEGGRELWVGDDLTVSPYGTLLVAVPVAALQPGQYRIKITSGAGTEGDFEVLIRSR